jgi:hypothetical protein
MSEKNLRFEPDSPDILERGTYVQIRDRGHAIRWAIARAAFLDRLLRDDDIVGEVVDELNRITSAPAIVSGLTVSFNELFDLARKDGLIRADGIRPTQANLSREARAATTALVRHRNELCDQLFDIVTGKNAGQSQALILTASRWTFTKNVYWPWLVSDLVNWYRDKVLFQNPYGGWRGTVRREPEDWQFRVADDTDLLPELVLRRRTNETAEHFRKRAREACASFLDELEDQWPAGHVPSDTVSIGRKVGWFYDHRIRGISISALSKEFADKYREYSPGDRQALIDGRRKDVREGIRDAGTWLGSAGTAFTRSPSLPPATSQPNLRG